MPAKLALAPAGSEWPVAARDSGCGFLDTRFRSPLRAGRGCEPRPQGLRKGESRDETRPGCHSLGLHQPGGLGLWIGHICKVSVDVIKLWVAQSSDPAIDGVELEFEGAEFGDKRLATRVEGLAGAMAREPSASFPQALSAAELEAAYRFFGNVKVTKLLAKCRVHALHWRSLCDTSPLPRAIVDRLPSLVTPHPACTALGGGAEGAPNGCEHDT